MKKIPEYKLPIITGPLKYHRIGKQLSSRLIKFNAPKVPRKLKKKINYSRENEYKSLKDAIKFLSAFAIKGQRKKEYNFIAARIFHLESKVSRHNNRCMFGNYPGPNKEEWKEIRAQIRLAQFLQGNQNPQISTVDVSGV
jgi:hypothetical protein